MSCGFLCRIRFWNGWLKRKTPEAAREEGVRNRARNVDGGARRWCRVRRSVRRRDAMLGRRCIGSAWDSTSGFCVVFPTLNLIARLYVLEYRSCERNPASGAGFTRSLQNSLRRRVVPFRDSSLATFSIIRTKKTGHDPEFVALKYRHGAKTLLAKFEECLQRLEKIVEELEKVRVQLEKSLTLFEEGIQLSSACRKELEQAEGKVEMLLKKNGKLQAEPFEPVAEKATTRR